MTATIHPFPMRNRGKAGAGDSSDERREASKKARADVVRGLMAKRTRLDAADRERLAFNLGSLISRWFDSPKKRVAEIFEKAFEKRDVVSSKLKKRKNWIRFPDEARDGPFAADRRDFLQIAEAVSALSQKPLVDALLSLVRGSSLDESGVAHNSLQDEAIHEVLTGMASAMNRVRNESRIDSYFQAVSSDLLKAEPFERWEAGDGIPFSPASFQDRFAQGGWFGDIAAALPRIPIAVLFRTRPVHFVKAEAPGLGSVTQPPSPDVLAAAYIEDGYAKALDKAVSDFPGGNSVAFESYCIDLVIAPRARGNVIEPSLAISIQASEMCAAALRKTAISEYSIGDNNDGTRFASWDGGAAHAAAFLRYPKQIDENHIGWLDIEGLEGGDDIAVIDADLCRSFLVRNAVFSSDYDPSVPDEGWLMLELLFANDGGLTPPVPAPTLGAAILRNLAFANDSQRLDNLLIAETDRRASELDDWIRGHESDYRNAMRERFGRYKPSSDGEP